MRPQLGQELWDVKEWELSRKLWLSGLGNWSNGGTCNLLSQEMWEEDKLVSGVAEYGYRNGQHEWLLVIWERDEEIDGPA